jgi:hypothetical protein
MAKKQNDPSSIDSIYISSFVSETLTLQVLERDFNPIELDSIFCIIFP